VFVKLQVSGYPSDTRAANVSKDTTESELLSVGNVPLDTFKAQNINLMFGVVNNIEYCQEMFNFPDLYTLNNLYKEKIKSI